MSMGDISPTWVRRLINFWPPLLFAGIRVRIIADDWRQVEVELRLRWWNRNAVGAMFGGSLFSMTDPFYPLMLQHNLGPGYAVWTKSATVEFIAPGRRLARGSFRLSEAEVLGIVAATDGGESCCPAFVTEIVDHKGALLARVNAIVYVKRKRAKSS